MQNITVKAVAHKDIKGKEMLYIIIEKEDNGEKVIINVGEKNFKAVENLLKTKK
jgi:hypothetical protein